jgi:hypothetical protein
VRRTAKNNRAMAEIAMLAPWVVALRLARFADTRPRSRKRNLEEAARMTSEKSAALAESAWAAGTAMMRAQWRLFETFSAIGTDVVAAAAHPVGRRVKRNARRLRR